MTEAEASEELKAREPIFHRPELGTSRAHFERMTDERFWEVGASGRVYGRGFVLENLERRYATPHVDEWDVSDFACRALGGSTFVATYLRRALDLAADQHSGGTRRTAGARSITKARWLATANETERTLRSCPEWVESGH